MSSRSGSADGGRGPVDDTPWPGRLRAHRVQPGPEPRIDGYEFFGDLAEHYSYPELVLFSLSGTLPNTATGAAFERCLRYIMATSIAEGPTHAASLARLLGATVPSVASVGALGQVAASAHLLDELRPLRAWLTSPTLPYPGAFIAQGEADRAHVSQFRRGLKEPFYGLPIFGQDPSLAAAVLGVLVSCGVDQDDGLVTVFALARLPLTIAEAMTTKPGAFDAYPMNVPAYRYVEDPDRE